MHAEAFIFYNETNKQTNKQASNMEHKPIQKAPI